MMYDHQLINQLNMCVYIYTHTYTCIHIHTCVYIYIYISTPNGHSSETEFPRGVVRHGCDTIAIKLISYSIVHVYIGSTIPREILASSKLIQRKIIEYDII